MGPMGVGFIYVRPELFKKLQPVYAGWLSVENAWDFLDYKLEFLPDVRRYEYALGQLDGKHQLAPQ